jgi:spermidine synthase
MFLRDETIIHKSQDEFGDIVVADGMLLRTLYFGNLNKQSCMYINHSSLLVLEYTQAMMLSLLFSRNPKRILIIGLGGGSLCKFFLRHCPLSHIDVVEIRPRVIRIAHDFFDVPEQHPNLNVKEADAVEFIAQVKQRYDMVFVDAFDADGPASLSTQADFLAECQSRLSPFGLLCVNLWSRREDKLPKQHTLMRRLFDDRAYLYQLGAANSNALLFGFNSSVDLKNTRLFDPRMRQLAAESGIDLSSHFAQLKQQNQSIWSRWFAN